MSDFKKLADNLNFDLFDNKNSDKILEEGIKENLKNFPPEKRKYFLDLVKKYPDSICSLFLAVKEQSLCLKCNSIDDCKNTYRGRFCEFYEDPDEMDRKFIYCKKMIHFMQCAQKNIVHSSLDPNYLRRKNNEIISSLKSGTIDASEREKIANIMMAVKNGGCYFFENYGKDEYYYAAAAQSFLNGKKLVYLSIGSSLNPFNINSNSDMDFFKQIMSKIDLADVVIMDDFEESPYFASFFDMILIPLVHKSSSKTLIMNAKASIDEALDPFHHRNYKLKEIKSKVKKFATFSQLFEDEQEKSPLNRAFYNKVVTLERFELPAHSLEGCCSIQLSYRANLI